MMQCGCDCRKLDMCKRHGCPHPHPLTANPSPLLPNRHDMSQYANERREIGKASKQFQCKVVRVTAREWRLDPLLIHIGPL